MSDAPVLDIQDVSISFGGITALESAHFAIRGGEVCGLIGPNGAGKTTLFNCITGLCRPDKGRILYRGKDLVGLPPFEVASLGVGRTFQNGGLSDSDTVLDNVLLGTHVRGTTGIVAAPLGLRSVRREEQRLASECHDILGQLGLGDLHAEVVGELPPGVRRRVEVARALAFHPKLLLLDEPASGLLPDELALLTALMRSLGSISDVTIVVVEHNMGFVMKLCDRIVALSHGRVIAVGTPDEVAADPEVVASYLGGTV